MSPLIYTTAGALADTCLFYGDPFCGCGTAIAAAEKSDRRWIGIDVTHLAIASIRTRLCDAYGTASSTSSLASL
ncbi:MAG TPA: hypothetical protein VIC55_03430 [Gemmatimonadaceae bacterium]